MNLSFSHPEALILIPLWGAAAWLFPKARLLKPLRLAVGLLWMLAWMAPHLPLQSRGLDLWVLVDRSDSARDLIEPRLPEMQTLLEQSRNREDRLIFVDFAEDVIQRDPLTATVLSGFTDSTRLATALHFTLDRIAPRRHTRLLLLSDGYSTEPLEEAGLRLLRENIPLDLRAFTPLDAVDYRVESINAPLRVRPGEPFLIEAHITGTRDGDIPVQLRRNGEHLAEGIVTLVRGRGRIRWPQRLDHPGAAEYEVSIHPEEDTWPGNNRQRHWVEAGGGRRVLLVSAYEDDPLARLLRDRGMEVALVTRTATLRPGHLSGVASVILNNVSAFQVPGPFLEAIPFFVREQGGGFIMVGGKAGFGSGGYFQSAVDELLPVSMELKQEHRKLAAAVAIVMDRSGSMNAGVPGAPGATKMSLANEGAAQAIDLLGDMDAVTVFAVDTQPHLMVPLTTLGGNRSDIAAAVRRIQSSGGGIYVYEGLKAGWEELQKAQQGQRHIILFSDASDSERPQGYERIVDEMLRENATLSVIALGTENDRHGDLLKEIAARGQGRILFNADAAQLPMIFAQETVALSRSAFLQEPVGLQPMSGWSEIAAAPLPWPAHIDGYNLSYLRPGAAVSLLTADEYEAPLLAHWTRGLGRVAAVSFPLGGEASDTVRAWPAYGDFVRTLVDWTLRRELPGGLALRQTREGEHLRIDLHHDESWEAVFALAPPELHTVSAADPDPRAHAWRRMSPGRFTTQIPLRGQDRLRGALKAGEGAIPFGPVSAPVGAEWEFDPAMPRALQQLSRLSQGVNRLDLATVWDAPRRITLRSIRSPLLILLLLAFLTEAALVRLDGQRPSLDLRRPVRRAPAPKPPRPAHGTPEPPEPEPSPARRRAFQQARHRNRLP
ncbi:MAG: VWA domain-containing protein [Verrucomicrobia bacterium]|nr:VWA domain-containing protein [Verrucomicrobiota bacterium]MCH8526779.1 VWA domain-containing protein [Kiritimatiellia bacterium]